MAKFLVAVAMAALAYTATIKVDMGNTEPTTCSK